MTATEERLDKFLHSGFAAALIAAVSLVAMLVASGLVRPYPLYSEAGVVLPPPGMWFAAEPSPWLDVVAVALQAVVAGAALLLNYRFKVVRSACVTFAAVFLALQAMLPGMSAKLTAGPYVALLILVGLMLLLAAYNRPRSTMTVALAFFVVSAGGICESALVMWLPAMLVGLGQMRILRLKALLAAAFGAIAPWWIIWCVWGGDLLPAVRLHPEDARAFLTAMPVMQQAHLIVCVCLSVVFGAGLSAANMLRVFNTNSRSRACNWLLMWAGLCATVALVLDFADCAAWLTLLNVAVALQVANFMKYYDGKRVCNIVVLGMLGLSLLMYGWAVWI